MNKQIEKLHMIANIENEYYSLCGKKWLSLEEELEMAIAFGNDGVADIIRNKMIEREIRILHSMFGGA